MNNKLSSESITEWQPTKNQPLLPENLTSGSGKKVWWKCPKGADHEWEARIADRTIGRGCLLCAGKRVTKFNTCLIQYQ